MPMLHGLLHHARENFMPSLPRCTCIAREANDFGYHLFMSGWYLIRLLVNWLRVHNSDFMLNYCSVTQFHICIETRSAVKGKRLSSNLRFSLVFACFLQEN